MLHVPFFRRKLAHRLRNCAARRRHACGCVPSGDDLKVIALLGRLSRDAEHVPQDVVDRVARRCADPAFAQRFETTWDSLDDVVGTLLVPRDATDLIRWMVDQAGYGFGGGGVGEPASGRTTTGSSSKPLARSTGPRPRAGLASSVVGDFTGALAVVGPALAIWEGSTAVAQWRDHALVRWHPQSAAVVVGATTYDGGRGTSQPATETLRFTPAGGQTVCTVTVPLGSRSPSLVGQELTVVPRSNGCEAPLIVAAIGNPMTSLTMAVAFLASGIASLKLWRWLRPQPKPHGPAACPPRMPLRVAS